MVDLAALRSAQPGLLDQAASEWKSLGGALGGQVSTLRGNVISPLFSGGNWTGTAANAAQGSLSQLSGSLTSTQQYAETMTSLLQDAASGIRQAQSWLTAADGMAAASKLTIVANGTGAQVTGATTATEGAATEVAQMITQALTVATDTDSRVTSQLSALAQFPATGAASMLGAAGNLKATLDKDALPPPDASPAEVNAWWKALSRAQQQALIKEFPAQLGWLNGLPAIARDQANRLAMANEQAALKTQLAALEAHPPPQTLPGSPRFGPEPNPAYAQWQQQIATITGKLAGISAVETGISNADKSAGAKNVFLLGFDTTGNGHAIVAVGNPDTAVNTVTYVPGLGSKLTGATGDIGRATALWAQASKTAGGASVSSIYWLGYNAPQLGVSQGLHNLDVTSTSDAVAGGVSLSHFEAGLAAAHQAGLPDHTVVLGHSYGSLVVGEAAAHDGMHPDDIITVGSPGVGVNTASALGIPPAHVWAGANASDPVPRLPPTNPVTALENPSAAHFGTNPASTQFGGQVFNADIDPSKSFSSIDTSAHSAYWDPNSSSLTNMGHIVDGQYSQVTAGPQAPPNLEAAAQQAAAHDAESAGKRILHDLNPLNW